MKSVKKTFNDFSKFRLSTSYIVDYISKFKQYFQQHRFDNTETAKKYILGLLKCAKSEANMERMAEEIPKSEYRAYQHFISNSNWDCEGLKKSVALECSQVLSNQKLKNKKPTGYIVDESSHLKKGKESVGVGRQYAGVIGKVG